MDETKPWTCDQLRERDDKQQRWLSRPHSRVVVNPFNFKKSGATSPFSYSNRSTMPLNIGYLSPFIPESEVGLEFSDLLLLHTDEGSSPRRIQGLEWPGVDLLEWTMSEHDIPEDGTAIVDASGMKITVHNDARDYWQYATAVVELDLEETSILNIEVIQCLSAWSVKAALLDSESASEDIELITENSSEGVFTVNLAHATGWSGRKRFKLRLFAYGFGRTISFGRLGVAGVTDPYAEAIRFDTEWAPHELRFRADYPHNLKLEGIDFFLNTNRVCRSLALIPGSRDASILLGGNYSGQLTFHADHAIVMVKGEKYSFAIRIVGKHEEGIAYYANYSDYVSGCNSLVEPPRSGYWQLKLPVSDNAGDGIQIVVSFPGPNETAEQLLRGLCNDSFASLRGEGLADRRAQNERYWNALLAKVPRPALFSLEHVPSKGITSRQIEEQYYKSWVFLASNVLDRSPEAGYPYPQLCCGKPSLWGAGAKEAPYSASWESLFAIQLYAYIDPDLAWEAFKGLMSLVAPSGMLGGESLPSRKAQTAMILYELTGDKQSLRAVYPAIGNYLRWRADNPRWILGAIDNQSSKDSEFVVSALIDIAYFIRISELLGLQAEIPYWQQTSATLLAQYTEWFWDKPGGFAHQYYDVTTGQRSPGCTTWVLTGIYLPSLDRSFVDSMLQRFSEEFDIQKPFGGLPYPKHPDINFAIYGLVRLGLLEEARQLVEVCVRDVTLAGFFAEQYDVEDVPYPTGVRPSIFGCAQLIECVLMKNGYRLELGKPYQMRLFDEQGRVENIQKRDQL